FFQAEDGIRDATVTGVQTCALPICTKYKVQSYKSTKSVRVWGLSRGGGWMRVSVASSVSSCVACLVVALLAQIFGLSPLAIGLRSEERRVGKGGRCGWGGHRSKAHM